jgi:uncharacterized protein YegJ (DUF2314 family)
MSTATIWILLTLVGVALGILYARHRRSSKVLSLIVLYSEPTVLDRDRLEPHAQTLGMLFERGNEPGSFLLDGYAFHLISAPERYGLGHLDNEQVLERIREGRLREALREHQSFASFWFVDKRQNEWEEALVKVGKLVAEMADDAATVIWRADTNQAVRTSEEVWERMREGEIQRALGEFVGDEVISVDSDSPAMVAAVEEARHRWPEFVSAVGRLQDRESTIVKGRFTDGEFTEHMWVYVESADEAGAKGKLASQPMHVRFLREGSAVEVPLAEVPDWGYIEGEEAVGFFTEKIVSGSGST